MAKKISKAEAAARGTKADASRKKNVKKQLKKDGTGIAVYIGITALIVVLLFVLQQVGILP